MLAKKARISNSLGVSETGAPDTLTVREARSMARPSITMGSAAALVCEPATASSMAVSLPDAISANTGASSRAAALPDENSALLSSAVEEGWDVDTLEEHIHAIEHVLYPEVVQMLADGRVHVLESGKVAVDPVK